MITLTIDKRVAIILGLLTLNGLVIYGAYRKGYRLGVADCIEYINSNSSNAMNRKAT